MKKLFPLVILVAILSFFACKKEDKTIPNNNAPNYYGIPTIKVKNYVNRLYIDLSGREPLDAEMDSVVSLLESNNLKFSTREQIIFHLQFDETPQTNGDNFKQLFYSTIYGLQKARYIRGIPDVQIISERAGVLSAANLDLVSGNTLGYYWKLQQAQVYTDIMESDTAYKNGSITFNEMCRRMCYNPIYDFINMNSFNYVNAVFDNNLYRFPSGEEFDVSYNMVDADSTGNLFGLPGGNKYDFSSIVTNCPEFNDGVVTWVYRSYLSRFPTSQELFIYSSHYKLNMDLPFIIREVMKTDEYANF